MYEQIENIIVRTLSSFEYESLEKLKLQYSEDEIINAYKNSSVKNINYITKFLQNKLKKTPTWAKQEIVNQEIDKESQKEFEDFNNFIKEFRDE